MSVKQLEWNYIQPVFAEHDANITAPPGLRRCIVVPCKESWRGGRPLYKKILPNIGFNTIFQCGKCHRHVANNILIINVNILHNFRYCHGGVVQSQNKRKIDIASLYSEYGEALYRFLTRKLPSHDAADLLHDTFVRVLCLADGYELRSPRPFLFRVARNLILDHHKAGYSKVFEVDASGGVEQRSTDHITPEVSVYSQQRLTVLRQAIDELPPRCRQVFLLHKFEHKSHAAIAEMLGISVNMVEKHVIRALAHCRQRLVALD